MSYIKFIALMFLWLLFMASFLFASFYIPVLIGDYIQVREHPIRMIWIVLYVFFEVCTFVYIGCSKWYQDNFVDVF